MRSNVKLRYDDYLDGTDSKPIKIIDSSKEYYEYSDFRSKKSYNNFKLDILRNTMEKYNLKFNMRIKKKELYFLLQEFLISVHDNKKNSVYIIKIQRWYRTMNLIRRLKCVNSHDFYIGNNKFEVSLSDVFIIKDISGHYYWFEINTFGNLLDTSETDNIKNPYTLNVIDKYYIHKFQQKYSNIEFNITLDDLNKDQLSRNRALSIFQKINKLDNYSDFNWFYNLSLSKLKKMYAVCEDIWNYRAQLPWTKKTQIVKDGMAFKIIPYVIQQYQSKDIIQNILLDDFDRLCSEGKTPDDKKLGAMLILTALVEVSYPASIAMPQYVQGANIF
jgi:hypothetical protein